MNVMSLVILKFSLAQSARKHFRGEENLLTTNGITMQNLVVKNVLIVKSGFQATAHLQDIYEFIQVYPFLI